MKIAIVTGASSGMGREFALKLDKFGLDEIWGIGLESIELNKMAKEFSTKFVPLSIDLTDDKSFEILKELLDESKPEISWLINASGYGKFGRFDEINIDTELNMIDLNCKATVHLTRLALLYSVRGTRIVQFSSVAGFQPVPYMNVYAASKAFILSYSRALNVELKSKGISVTCVAPYWTKTHFFDRAEVINSKTNKKTISKFVVMYDPKKVIDKAYNDALKRKELSVCGFVSNAQNFMTKLLPHKLVMKVWGMQQGFDKIYKNTNEDI